MQAAGNLGPLGPWQEKAPLSLVGVTLVGRVVSLLGTHEVSLLLCRFSHLQDLVTQQVLFSCTVPSRGTRRAVVVVTLGRELTGLE